MASAEIGGDSSVEWTLISDHVRQGNPPDNAPNGNGGWKQHGVDEADFNQNFTISIKIPNDRNNANTLASTLNQAAIAAQAQAGNPGTRISFLLPIEAKSSDQIQVNWTSAPLLAKHPHPSIAFARWLGAQWKAINMKKPKGKKKATRKAQKPLAKKARRKKAR
jgi:hypothetical protein